MKGKRGKSLITLKPGFLLSDVTLVMDLVHDVEGDQLRVEVGVVATGHGRIRINQLPVSVTSGLYYKHVTIVNDDSSIISK